MADETAAKVAEFLLRIKAVELSPQKPFRWSSGLLSPIYCDNRKILSYPHIRRRIREALSERLKERFGIPDAIVGVATGGIAMGALVAEELALPFAYVRGEPKGHGKENTIEGALEEGAETIVIEDLISTGKSSLNAVQRLKEGGFEVKGLCAIFSYGFEEAERGFRRAGCPYSVLTEHPALIQKALEGGAIPEQDLNSLEEWRKAPKAWSERKEVS